MKAALRAWWTSREPRERTMLAAGGVATVLILLYAVVWDPIQSAANRLTGELPRLREQSAQFARDAAEAERLRAQGGSRGAPPPLATAIQESAERTQLQGAIKNVQTLSPDRAQVTMGVVAFDALMRFLGDLGQGAGVAVESLATSAVPEAGKVQVEGLVLKSMRTQ